MTGPELPPGRPGGNPGEPPPPGPFRTWRLLYLAVIAWAAFLVLALWAAGELLTP